MLLAVSLICNPDKPLLTPSLLDAAFAGIGARATRVLGLFVGRERADEHGGVEKRPLTHRERSLASSRSNRQPGASGRARERNAATASSR